jgi:hypothetical protein
LQLKPTRAGGSSEDRGSAASAVVVCNWAAAVTVCLPDA